WACPGDAQHWQELWLLPEELQGDSQIPSKSGGRKMSVTKQTGCSAGITCDIPLKTTSYVHWYRQSLGWAPHCILYFLFTGSNVVVEAGITSGKYYAFEGSGRTCKLVVGNVQQSDAAVDYCAACESQLSSNSKGRTMSVTKQNGSVAAKSPVILLTKPSTTSTATDNKLERPHTTFSNFQSLAQRGSKLAAQEVEVPNALEFMGPWLVPSIKDFENHIQVFKKITDP
ncbi:T cell receptor gamma variable 8, partial [Galemys pyrenaicus]